MQAALPDPIVGHVGDLIVADRDVRLPLHPHRPGLPVTEKYLDAYWKESAGSYLVIPQPSKMLLSIKISALALPPLSKRAMRP